MTATAAEPRPQAGRGSVAVEGRCARSRESRVDVDPVVVEAATVVVVSNAVAVALYSAPSQT